MNNGYIAIFGNKKIEIYAPSMWAATEQARKASIFAKDKWMIEQEGQPLRYASRITQYVKAIM